MATLIYKGLTNPSKGYDPDTCRIGVAGVGWVKVGDTFEIDDPERVRELLNKSEHNFDIMLEDVPLSSEEAKQRAAKKKGK
jgi:hypothetical protein